MQTELENKHHEKRKLRKEICSIGIKPKPTLGLTSFNALLHQLHIVVKKQTEVRYLPPSKEIIYFTNKQKQRVSDVNHIRDEHMKNIVHNYSSYELSKDEELALSYGLENHIPTKTSHIAINT